MKAFVLMPFDAQYNQVYSQVYKPVCAGLGVECWRVDEITRPGSITKDIVEGIFDADIVIADLTSRNPNVFYELGIAHAAGNKTITTAQSIKDVPFDIANYRVIVYKQTRIGLKSLATRLSTAIDDLLRARDRTNNPVQDHILGRRPFTVRDDDLLSKHMDFYKLTRPMRSWLDSNSIRTVGDLQKIEFWTLLASRGIGQKTITRFLSDLINNNLYHDKEKLNQFILDHRIRIEAVKP
jgi:hypothetical protein